MPGQVGKAEPTLGRLPCGGSWSRLVRGRPLNLGKADGGTRAIAVRRMLELGETGPARPRSHCGTWGRQMAALGRLPCAGC